MGVMSCSRPNCPQIMCDICVDGIGYICYECRKEFEEYLQKQGIAHATEGEIKRELQKFMATEKDSFVKGKDMTVNEFFKLYDRHS